MKRVIISFCILSAMIGLGIFFDIRVSSECNKLIKLVELTQESMDSGNKEEALAHIRNFKSEWDSFYKEALCIVRGDKLSEIDNCYVRIFPLIESDNDEFSAELSELKNMLIRTKESEIPTILNIL